VVSKGYVGPVWIVLDPEGRMFRWPSAGTVPSSRPIVSCACGGAGTIVRRS